MRSSSWTEDGEGSSRQVSKSGVILLSAALLAIVGTFVVGGRSQVAAVDLEEPSVMPLPSPKPRVVPTPPECFLGVILASEAVEVVAEIEGRLEEVLVGPGDILARGDRIAVVDASGLHHQLTIERGNLALVDAEVGSFSLQLETAEKQLQRLISLGDLIARQEVERAEIQHQASKYRLDVANAEMVQARARIARIESQLERAVIRAPFAGVVAVRYRDAGARATPGTPVIRLIGSGASRVRFAVPPAVAAAVVPGATVRVEIETLTSSASGVVEHRSPEIDDISQMVFVEARLELGSVGRQAVPAGAVARVSGLSMEESQTNCLGL